MKRSLSDVIAHILHAQAPRAGSLAITLFGDAIAPQGNSVWLGSLVEVMQQFGLNPRQSRTAIFRLGRDGWLSATQRGRRRYYRYTDLAQRQYARAAERIYAVGTPAWDGAWTLIMTAGIDAALRDELRKRLGWLGFGTLANGLMAHPQPQGAAVEDTLRELDLGTRVVVWRAQPTTAGALAELVGACWQLDALAQAYRGFIDDFSPALALVSGRRALDPRAAFVLRTLLVHAYRRILLKDTDLPPALLPLHWPGHEAMELAARLYHAVQGAATDYCRSVMLNQDGGLPPPDRSYFQRFGGLARTPVAA